MTTRPSAALADGRAPQPSHSTVWSQSRGARWLRRSPWVLRSEDRDISAVLLSAHHTPFTTETPHCVSISLLRVVWTFFPILLTFWLYSEGRVRGEDLIENPGSQRGRGNLARGLPGPGPRALGELTRAVTEPLRAVEVSPSLAMGRAGRAIRPPTRFARLPVCLWVKTPLRHSVRYPDYWECQPDLAPPRRLDLAPPHRNHPL